MRRLPVVRHLTADEARARYRACSTPVERSRWQVVCLLLRTDRPRTPAQVGEVVGLSVVAVRGILRRWNARGPGGLADRRRGNGAAATLAPEQPAELLAALRQPPPDGGLWSGPKVAAFVRRLWGVEVVPQTGWQWLRDPGFRRVVPRPRHPKAATADEPRRWL